MTGLLLMFLCALFFPGIIAVVKSKVSGRKGPGLWQPLYDIVRLLKKGSVYSTTTSFIFQIAPVICFITIVAGLCIMPFAGMQKGIISFEGDILLFAYLLALGKFMMIISALDTGSGFEGMGANREALYSMLVEPAFFVILAAFAMTTNHISFFGMFSNFHTDNYAAYLFAALSVYLLLQIAMIENSRLPVDDPRTHLELTMVHEVIVLDNSGFDLGIIQLGNALKFSLYGGMICNIVLAPAHLGTALSIVLFIVIQALFAVTVGLLESFRPRFKMTMNPKFILTLTVIAIVAFFTVFIINQSIK